LTPVSAISNAVSRSSYKASSICVPVKTVAMLAPVLRKPVLSLSIQELRAGAGAGEAAGGCPGAGGNGSGAASGGITSAGTGAGAGIKAGMASVSGGVLTTGWAGAGGFFLKKLNILWVRGITAFYETQSTFFFTTRYGPIGLCIADLGGPHNRQRTSAQRA
jgi:hypothetical protein